ncbi:gamma-tubulin complex component 4 homolog isoform X2 [Condylostylus longicornis]|uniref:gamma-tubulin complex component 4 homolog isoform X2 n=1 Tax=Condylostylus longicornis TaxID=2530218 RepID=UPI00244DFCBB|nr:gamma-tubulin complex component 4 homolog isoform X2 [Condylostylus longicornis]
MIHDILLSLLNPYADNLPIENFLVTDYVSVFLHPCERKILEDILEIINLHREISKFTRYYRIGQDLNDFNASDDTEAQKLHGCAIMQYLNQNMLNGNQQIYLASKTIQSTVNIVFLKHLTHWLLYAKMIDSYGEFFIQHVESQNSTGNSTLENGIGLSSGESGKQTVTSFSEAVSTYADIWRYEISYDYLPHFITPSVARKILFIGQTVLMFKMDAAKKRLELWNEPEKQALADGSLWNNNEHKYFQKIQNLQKENNLTVSQFDVLINEIKSYITERLSQIAVKQADLVHQLKLIKDFYLLGRGELFLEFIKKTHSFEKSFSSENIVRDIVIAFESAANGIGLTEELEQFSITVPKENLNDSDDQNLPYIHYLTLQYKIIWPLHLLFSPKVIERYNELFRFLLQIKRLQYDLHMVWCNNRETKSKPNIFRLHLRNQFIFLIDNLQYYIQVDVLESQFSILMNIVNNSSDFEEIQRAHSVFQANILSLCFLLGNNENHEKSEELIGNNSVLLILQEIFAKCETFCNYEKESEEAKDQIQEQYEFLEERLRELVEQLMNLLFDLKSAPSSTPLSQLLLRLDYNNWFCKNWKNKLES